MALVKVELCHGAILLCFVLKNRPDVVSGWRFGVK
jgi:hypothetical protein